MIETHKRSILKALTWRGMGMVFTVTVVFLFTKKAALSIGIASLDALVKLVAYYFHERVWDRINIGRVNNSIHYKR